MAKDPAFLFYPGDYLKDTQCLSEKSQVAYDRIMCEHMRNICSVIGVSQEQLSFFTKRLSDDEKSEVMRVLRRAGDFFQIEWVVESISKRKAYSESRRKNKEGKTKNISKSYDSHMENAIENEDEIKIVPINTIERKNAFLTGTKWKEEFCMAKSLQITELERLMIDFVSDCDLKGQYVDNYKKYFTNWFNKKQNETHKRAASGGFEKAGTSSARLNKAKGFIQS